MEKESDTIEGLNDEHGNPVVVDAEAIRNGIDAISRISPLEQAVDDYGRTTTVPFPEASGTLPVGSHVVQDKQPTGGKTEATGAFNSEDLAKGRDGKGRFIPGYVPVHKPKGKHMKTLLMEALKKTKKHPLTGEIMKVEDIIIDVLVTRASGGNDASINTVLDRIDGRPKETLEINNVEITPEAEEMAERAINEYLQDLAMNK